MAHCLLLAGRVSTVVLVGEQMSVDHSVIKQGQSRPPFMGVKPGDVVVVWDHPELVDSDTNAWWMGKVIFVEGSARNPKAPALFQIADVDSGVIRWVNADCVQKVLISINKQLSDVISIR